MDCTFYSNLKIMLGLILCGTVDGPLALGTCNFTNEPRTRIINLRIKQHGSEIRPHSKSIKTVRFEIFSCGLAI